MGGNDGSYTFRKIRRLLAHLRRGGSRESACALAGITPETLEDWERTKERLARAVDRAVKLSLAADETRLDKLIRSEDKAALLFRMREQLRRREREMKEDTGRLKYGQTSDYEQVEKRLEELPSECREAFIWSFAPSGSAPN